MDCHMSSEQEQRTDASDLYAWPSDEDLLAARRRIAPFVHRTPILTNRTFDDAAEAKLFFKCENLQRCGAFKMRGATNAVFSLSDEEAARGVVTHSSGNHAGALALAASLRKIPAYVVMPSNSLPNKMNAVEGYGAKLILCEPTQKSREETAARVAEETGATFVHPYDNLCVIAGQASVAAECIEMTEELDYLLVPVGGGGLLSGSLLTARLMRPRMKVIACEPEWADDAFRSWKSGQREPVHRTDTIADGLRTGLSPRTFSIMKEYVHEVVTVSEDAIATAMRLLFERMKLVVEPSGAVTLAAVLSGKVNLIRRRAALVISGGNADLDHLPWLKSEATADH